MDKYKIRKGIFNPRKTSDLRPEVKGFVGLEFLWRYGYTQDEGNYKNQIIYAVTRPDGVEYREWMDSMTEEERKFVCLTAPEEDIEFEAV